MIDEIDKQLKKDNAESGKEVDLKVSKKTRDLLKICKIVMNKSKYDDVILHLIDIYKETKILRKPRS